MGARLAVHDLLAARGRHRFAMLRVATLDEAEAAHRAGVELLPVPPAMISDRRFREVAPDAFAFPGENVYEIGGTGDFLERAFPLIKQGADAVYCSGALATVRALADHGVPVCGHVGLVPSKRTWTGGLRAVGKTLETAQLVWRQVKALEAAGTFAAEIEVVPHSVTEAIAERSSLLLISMGAGSAGHAQYLFADDVLGQNRGHVPRHAKVYADLAAEHDRLQGFRTEAMARFAAELHTGLHPAPQHVVDSDPEVVPAFRNWLDRQDGKHEQDNRRRPDRHGLHGQGPCHRLGECPAYPGRAGDRPARTALRHARRQGCPDGRPVRLRALDR
jgi:3-methyl-2-oxobutanoate hydroxymethyltransferase